MKKEEVRMLAKAEQMMDSGESKYVLYCGNRMMVSDQATTELGLLTGQTINNQIAIAIQEFEITSLKSKIALEKIQKKALTL